MENLPNRKGADMLWLLAAIIVVGIVIGVFTEPTCENRVLDKLETEEDGMELRLFDSWYWDL